MKYKIGDKVTINGLKATIAFIRKNDYIVEFLDSKKGWPKNAEIKLDNYTSVGSNTYWHAIERELKPTDVPSPNIFN